MIKKISSVILAAVICCSFSACKKTIVYTASDYVQPAETTESEKYTFNSAQEIESISDEALIELASKVYSNNMNLFLNSNFTLVEYFDLPPMETKGEGYISIENVRTEILYTNDMETDFNSDVPLNTDKIKAHAVKALYEFIRIQNTKGSDDDTGRLVTDEEIIYCGENASYVEYSARYTDNRSMYSDEWLVTYVIPRAERWVFLRNFVRNSDTNEVKLFGDLNKDYVQEQMDIQLNGSYKGAPLYREVTENDTTFFYCYYIAARGGGDWGINDTANLIKFTNEIDKETHIVSFDGWGEKIKTISISNTAP